MYDALTVAKWFIAWADVTGDDEGVSNLKLQKLLYYAQGHHLATTGRPLFRNDIQAWSHGPVVPDVYHAYKRAGRYGIALDEDDPFDWGDIDDARATHTLQKVWNTYGGYTAWRLRNMTHEEAPWKEYWQDGAKSVVIPNDTLRRFFLAVG